MQRMKSRRKIFAGIMLCVFILDHAAAAWAARTLNINFIAVNATDQAKAMEIKQYMPAELTAEDIMESGDLKVEYDPDKKIFFVSGKFDFQPKESRTFKVQVKDVWNIQQEEVDLLKRQLDNNIETLRDHESYGAAQEARDEMYQQLDFIMAQQQNYSQNIERRIEEYRAYRNTLENVRNNIYSMDYLKFESKARQEVRNKAKTVKLLIEVKNPSDTESQTVTEKHYLPEEIRAADVVDGKGFEVRFDENKGRAYLTKEETFAPGETKKYEIILKDVWQFPYIKLQDLDDRTQIAMGELQGTIYEDSAQYLLGNIQSRIAGIRNAPQSGISVEKHIGIYRTNQKRFDEAWQDFKRIEEMIAIVRAKKLEELEKGKVKNVLQRLKALRGLRALSEALFKKTLSITVTWRIIMGTILFIATLTTIHFVMWAKRSGKQGEEHASADGGIKVVPKPGQQGSEEKNS